MIQCNCLLTRIKQLFTLECSEYTFSIRLLQGGKEQFAGAESVSVVLGAGQQNQLNQSLVVMVHYEHYVYTVFLYFPLYRFT